MTPEQIADTPLLLTVSKAAKLIGVSKGTLYSMVRKGDVRTLTVGKTTMIPTRPLLRQVGVDLTDAAM